MFILMLVELDKPHRQSILFMNFFALFIRGAAKIQNR